MIFGCLGFPVVQQKNSIMKATLVRKQAKTGKTESNQQKKTLPKAQRARGLSSYTNVTAFKKHQNAASDPLDPDAYQTSASIS